MRKYFNKEQYERLMQLVYLGEWMINSYRLSDERLKEYEELEERILFYAGGFGLEGYVDRDRETGKIYPSRSLEEKADEFLEEYDDQTFWDELIERLKTRDMERKYGRKSLELMSLEERFRKEDEFSKMYDDEFGRNGIANLEVGRSLNFGFLKRLIRKLRKRFGSCQG